MLLLTTVVRLQTARALTSYQNRNREQQWGQQQDRNSPRQPYPQLEQILSMEVQIQLIVM